MKKIKATGIVELDADSKYEVEVEGTVEICIGPPHVKVRFEVDTVKLKSAPTVNPIFLVDHIRYQYEDQLKAILQKEYDSLCEAGPDVPDSEEG